MQRARSLKKRKASRTVFTFDIDALFPHLPAHETADRDALERDLRETLDAKLGQLPPKYREPLILYYYEGLSYKDMADILRIPISTVGVRLGRGKALLQKVAANKHIV